eukprot:6172236-Pleurochrysis_carterae.AAC.4
MNVQRFQVWLSPANCLTSALCLGSQEKAPSATRKLILHRLPARRVSLGIFNTSAILAQATAMGRQASEALQMRPPVLAICYR